jgi:hypothetical protein
MGTISSRTTCLAIAFTLLRTVAPGQDAWRIPPLGAVEYSRTGEHKASDAVKSAAAAKQAPLAGKWPDRYLPRLPPAPWVCQGELRVDQKAIAGPVRDLRDAMRVVACDLGSRGGGRWKFERLLPFGDVVVSGSWSPPTADGAQTLKGTFAASKIALQTGEGRDVLERLLPFCVVDCSGSVAITRRLDPTQGLVVGWQANCDLVVDEGERSFRRIVVDEAHTLVAVRDNQDADFRVRVAAAIRAGTGWVRDAIDEQKSFLVEKGGDERNYGSGRLALGLLTLLHGHVPPDDAVVQRGFTELRKRRLEDSYSLAAALMAIAALHAPAGEAARLREGGLDRIAVHELPEKDRKVAQKWLQQLLANVDPRGEQIDLLRFNYTAGPRYDTSLQQYGLLGLWSAHGCGLELPKGAFAKAARHLLDVQGRNEGALVLRLCSYAQLRSAAGTELPPRQSEQRAQMRGFAYQEATEPAFGSMTSAGLSGLLLARSGMVARDEVERSLAPRLEAAVRDSYAWLAENFSVRCNPGFAERGDHHYYYWLYCLERSCELAGIARLHGRDWYYEGGVQLLSHQQQNGSFRAEHASTLLLDSTCFAVLFLAKATAAGPITGR